MLSTSITNNFSKYKTNNFSFARKKSLFQKNPGFMGEQGLAYHLFPEGHEGNRDEFEVLGGKGEPDDGDGEEEPEKEVDEGGVKPSAKEPDDVEQGRQTTGGGGSAHDLLTKGPEYQVGQFETLKAKGNADDRTAEQKTADNISQGGKEASAYHPDEISQQVHRG
jgi:hypothetical protein